MGVSKQNTVSREQALISWLLVLPFQDSRKSILNLKRTAAGLATYEGGGAAGSLGGGSHSADQVWALVRLRASPESNC
jgi:hypothetical protein